MCYTRRLGLNARGGLEHDSVLKMRLTCAFCGSIKNGSRRPIDYIFTHKSIPCYLCVIDHNNKLISKPITEHFAIAICPLTHKFMLLKLTTVTFHATSRKFPKMGRQNLGPGGRVLSRTNVMMIIMKAVTNISPIVIIISILCFKCAVEFSWCYRLL